MRMGSAIWTVLFLWVLVITTEADIHSSHQGHLRERRAASFSGKELRVVTIITEPYCTLSDSGNTRYEGFVPDLLEEISERTGLSYTIRPVRDARYGAYNPSTKTWNGMIGEVVQGENSTEGADMAAAPLTITSIRKGVVHFIHPFMHIELSVLMRKPYMQTNESESSFSVLEPLSAEVWAVVSACIIVVTLWMWLINKFNPYEWSGSWNRGHATEQQAETFNVSGALWYAFTTFQWQGFECAPRSAAARVLSGFWFAFITLTLVTYTGSMVNVLFWASSVHGKGLAKPPISSLEDLIMHPKGMDYGTIEGGSTLNYFKTRKGPEYDYMRKHLLDQSKQNLVRSTEEGAKRAREGNYGFILESTTAQYVAARKPCDLVALPLGIARRSYGFAIRKNLDMEIQQALHMVMMQMHEDGVLEELENRWFKDTSECWNVTKQEQAMSQKSAWYLNKPTAVTLKNFWGPLTILVVGLVFSFAVAAVEILYYKYKGQYSSKYQREQHHLHVGNVEHN